MLTARDVLVIDEAGVIGSRQMERVLSAADAAGAKVERLGDAEPLQAIEAGAAFRALTERRGAAEITKIGRQRDVAKLLSGVRALPKAARRRPSLFTKPVPARPSYGSACGSKRGSEGRSPSPDGPLP